MMDILFHTIVYTIDSYMFWPAMAFTTMTGIFVGAVIYDGNVDEIKKAIIVLTSYVFLLLTVNVSRVLESASFLPEPGKPFASAATTVVVSLFYIFGMGLGVKLVNKAHKK